jgi:hypothetical protein
VVWNTFSPPRQYYPVETYRAEFADEPDGLRLLPHDNPDAPASGPKISAEVIIARAIPMKRARRSWQEYSQTHLQPSQDAIDRAGPAFGLLVRLSSVKATPDGPMLFVWPPQRSAGALPAQNMPAEKVRAVLAALEADIRTQSGKPEYADAVAQGGVEPPPLSMWAVRENRFYVYLPVLVGFPLVTIARLIARRKPATANPAS